MAIKYHFHAVYAVTINRKRLDFFFDIRAEDLFEPFTAAVQVQRKKTLYAAAKNINRKGFSFYALDNTDKLHAFCRGVIYRTIRKFFDGDADKIARCMSGLKRWRPLLKTEYNGAEKIYNFSLAEK